MLANVILEYIEHGEEAICHNHPTKSDVVNRCIKALETALHGVDILSPFSMKLSGPIIQGQGVDVPFVIPFDGELFAFSLLCGNTGNTGNDLVIDIRINGSSIFSVQGNKPIIPVNSGVNQTDVTPKADMTTTTFSNGAILDFYVESCPDDAEDLSCSLWILPPQ